MTNCEAQLLTERAAQRYVPDTEAAAISGLKVSTLRKWRVLGKGPHFHRLGRRVVYNHDQLLRYIESCPGGGHQEGRQ
jgi:hypothetical protein